MKTNNITHESQRSAVKMGHVNIVMLILTRLLYIFIESQVSKISVSKIELLTENN